MTKQKTNTISESFRKKVENLMLAFGTKDDWGFEEDTDTAEWDKCVMEMCKDVKKAMKDELTIEDAFLKCIPKDFL